MGGKYLPPNRFEFVLGRNYGAVIRKEKARTISRWLWPFLTGMVSTNLHNYLAHSLALRQVVDRLRCVVQRINL